MIPVVRIVAGPGGIQTGRTGSILVCIFEPARSPWLTERTSFSEVQQLPLEQREEQEKWGWDYVQRLVKRQQNL